MHSTTQDKRSARRSWGTDDATRSAKGTGIIAGIAFANKRGGPQGYERFLQRLSPQERTVLEGVVIAVMQFDEALLQHMVHAIVDEFLRRSALRAAELAASSSRTDCPPCIECSARWETR